MISEKNSSGSRKFYTQRGLLFASPPFLTLQPKVGKAGCCQNIIAQTVVPRKARWPPASLMILMDVIWRVHKDNLRLVLFAQFEHFLQDILTESGKRRVSSAKFDLIFAQTQNAHAVVVFSTVLNQGSFGYQKRSCNNVCLTNQVSKQRAASH